MKVKMLRQELGGLRNQCYKAKRNVSAMRLDSSVTSCQEKDTFIRSTEGGQDTKILTQPIKREPDFRD